MRKSISMAALAALLIASSAEAATWYSDGAKKSSNAAAVVAFIELAFIQQKPTEAFAKYWPTRENPTAMAGMFKMMPNFKYDIRRVYVDGDFVIVHSMINGTPGVGQPVNGARMPAAPGAATPVKAGDEVVDMFRLQQGKIVQHWDVVEPITGSLDVQF